MATQQRVEEEYLRLEGAAVDSDFTVVEYVPAEGHTVHEVRYVGPLAGDGTDVPQEDDPTDFDATEVTTLSELAEANRDPWGGKRRDTTN